MKKLLLISALFAAGVSTASAQLIKGPTQLDKLEKEMLLTKDLLNRKSNLCPISGVKTANLPSTRADLEAYYGKPNGTFYGGYLFDENGDAGTYPPCFIGAGYTPWVFKNYSTEGMSYSWTLSGQNLDNDMDAAGNLTLMTGLGFYQDIPEITVSNGSQSVSYKFGSDKSEQALLFCSNGMLPMTCMDIYHNAYTGLINENDESFNAFGVGHLNGDDEEPLMDAFAGTFSPASPLYISSVAAYLISEDGTTASMMPADGTLELEIRTLDEEGKVTDEIVATAQMNAADLVKIFDYTNAESALYYAPFYFMEKDPVTGLDSQYNLIMSEPFAVVITGYNKPGYNFGVLFGDDLIPDGSGNSLFRIEGEERFVSYPKDEDNTLRRFNIGIHVEAVNPVLYIPEASQKLFVPAEGGVATFEYEEVTYNAVEMVSTYPLEQDDETCVWMDDIPSWLTVEPSDEYYAEQRVLAFTVTGEPLPDGVDGRMATLIFRSFGVEARANILQERVPGAAIDQNSVSIVKAVKNGENFDLTYPEDVNAVTVLNAAGQAVATYELPANGQFSMPAANLAKGLYILKFNGEKTAGIKIMK